jgi:hypothetical protein
MLQLKKKGRKILLTGVEKFWGGSREQEKNLKKKP